MLIFYPFSVFFFVIRSFIIKTGTILFKLGRLWSNFKSNILYDELRIFKLLKYIVFFIIWFLWLPEIFYSKLFFGRIRKILVAKKKILHIWFINFSYNRKIIYFHCIFIVEIATIHVYYFNVKTNLSFHISRSISSPIVTFDFLNRKSLNFFFFCETNLRHFSSVILSLPKSVSWKSRTYIFLIFVHYYFTEYENPVESSYRFLRKINVNAQFPNRRQIWPISFRCLAQIATAISSSNYRPQSPPLNVVGGKCRRCPYLVFVYKLVRLRISQSSRTD